MGKFRNCSKCSDCYIKLKIVKEVIGIFSRLMLPRPKININKLMEEFNLITKQVGFEGLFNFTI